jgi:hypothetical protein
MMLVEAWKESNVIQLSILEQAICMADGFKLLYVALHHPGA